MPNKNLRFCLVAGARPNFMKIAALTPHLQSRNVSFHLLHTGQHYDYEMSEIFFKELGLPDPDIHLNIGSGSQAEQTAAVMVAFEKYCMEYCPKHIVLVGDVNSTVACSLVASKLSIPITHVEAGLRSFDWEMPEEINRVVTDRLSNLYLIHSPEAIDNLVKEGVSKSAIVDTGNVMIDVQKRLLDKADASTILSENNLKQDGYVFSTMHRPANVDTKEKLLKFIEIVKYLSSELKFIMPLHPRTKNSLEKYGLLEEFRAIPNVILIKAVGYIDCLALVKNAKLVATDSGGLQEETTALGVPCITLRENTERPVTITNGTNHLVGMNITIIKQVVGIILSGNYKSNGCPVLWDGNAGARCVDAILEFEKTKTDFIQEMQSSVGI